MGIPAALISLLVAYFLNSGGSRLSHCSEKYSLQMPPNLKVPYDNAESLLPVDGNERYRCAILGTGMMGQEHISYINGYPKDIRIDFLVDPFHESLENAQKVNEKFRTKDGGDHQPTLLSSEDELLQHVENLDLLVIASPNYLHTDSLVKWGKQDITILVEKPVAVSQEQLDRLNTMRADPDFKARIWVGMEYRFIPAIAKLLSLVPSTIGDLKMITIRENRYPFLHKIGTWNRDTRKTGDTLVGT
jgi:myo-inositol 2-dehydrogenase / D-chiro-inositol 1-dehydrogenase